MSLYCQAQAQALSLRLSDSGSDSGSVTQAQWLRLSDSDQSLEQTLNLVWHPPPTEKLFFGHKWLQTITVWLITMSNWSWHSRWHSGLYLGWHSRWFSGRHSVLGSLWLLISLALSGSYSVTVTYLFFIWFFRAWLWSGMTCSATKIIMFTWEDQF